MDPLSTTASVIAILTLAAKSCKATYSLIDELVGIPQVMSHTKGLLSMTQKTFDSLQLNLERNSDAPEAARPLESFLRQIPLKEALQSAQELSQEFSLILQKCTRHSTGGKFSTRDRVTVSMQESKIQRYNKQLSQYQQIINVVLDSIILHIAKHTSRNVEELGDRFMTQEQTLSKLSEQLRNTETSIQASLKIALPMAEASKAPEEAMEIQRTIKLRELCEGTLAGTKESRTGQRFDQATTEDGSVAFQGISGAAQPGVEQSFGKLLTQKNSKAAQGQVTSEDFGKLFG